ncbi:MAG: hypothetical protein JXR49_17600 [Acidobacteria bacterium]|nr:hypothetical protein [Acidobacteriota bacterium]
MNNKRTAVKKTSIPKQNKPGLSPDATFIIIEAIGAIGRFSRMMQGLNCLCSNVDPGNQELYDFSFAVATIAELIQADTEGIAANLNKALEGGSHE